MAETTLNFCLDPFYIKHTMRYEAECRLNIGSSLLITFYALAGLTVVLYVLVICTFPNPRSEREK